MLINNFDPVALSIFSFEIRWYSLSYIFGIIFGWLYCVRFLIKEEYIINKINDSKNENTTRSSVHHEARGNGE